MLNAIALSVTTRKNGGKRPIARRSTSAMRLLDAVVCISEYFIRVRRWMRLILYSRPRWPLMAGKTWMSSWTRCLPTGIDRRVRFFWRTPGQTSRVQDPPDRGDVGGRKALTQFVSDAFGAVGRMGLPQCDHGLTIGIGHDLAAVLLGRRRAISAVSSANPALNGASMHAKAASQFGLGGAVLVQPSHQRALRSGQGGFGVIMHGRIHSIVDRTPAECANLL